MDDIKAVKLREGEYIFEDETGDIILSKQIAAREELENNEYVTIEFLEEENQTHFPLYKVHKNFYNIKLEWIK